MNAVYCKSSAIHDLAEFPFESSVSNENWAGLELNQSVFDVSDEALQRISKQVGTVIFLSFQSAVDAFQFVKVVDGVTERKLVYGCYKNEREWEVVEGTEQEWEEDLFIETTYDDEDEEEYEDAIAPEVGSCSPMIDARNIAIEIASYYNFPGWD